MAATKDKKTRLHGCGADERDRVCDGIVRAFGVQSPCAAAGNAGYSRACVQPCVRVGAACAVRSVSLRVSARGHAGHADRECPVRHRACPAISPRRIDGAKTTDLVFDRAFGDVRCDDRAAEDPRTSKIRLALYRLRYCAFVPFDVFRDGKRRLAQLVSDRVVFRSSLRSRSRFCLFCFWRGSFPKIEAFENSSRRGFALARR